MLILALETATRAGSLALFSDRGPGPAITGDPARTHGVRLPGELLAFAAAHGRTVRDIDYFAVVTGPGSFTGLRIGLATVQGLALAQHRLVIGIPTLEAIVSGWIDEHAGHDGVVVACLDAARGDVFYAAYDATRAASIESARVLIEPRVASPDTAVRDLAGLHGAAAVTIVGDGTLRHAATLSAGLPEAVIDARMPNLAAAAARLSARRLSSAGAPHALRPIYVRRPDAELARERAVREQTDSAVMATAGSEWTVFEVRDPDQVAAVARLQERSFGDAWGVEALSGSLARPNVSRLFAVRRRSGEIVAYCACWQVVDELHINSLAVDPSFRRRGIARMLLRYVMAAAAATGARGATLEVRESNHAGRALYEGFGFHVEGVRRAYYQNPREDALILWNRALVPA